jgi:hypothetical protein
MIDPTNSADPLGNLLDELNSSMATPIQQTGGSGYQYKQSGVYEQNGSPQRTNYLSNSSGIVGKNAQPTILHKIISYSFFLFFVFVVLVFNIHMLDKSFQVTQVDCRENKCYRENVLDYNRKTWLNIQKLTYDDCFENMKTSASPSYKLRAEPLLKTAGKMLLKGAKKTKGLKNQTNE